MNAAILPFRPATPAGLIQLAASEVGFNLHVASIDRRRKTATCELVLANQSIRAVSGRLFRTNRHLDERTFGALEVAPRSLGRSLFTVPLSSWRGRNDERVYVEVLGEGLHLLAAAHAPAISKRGGSLPAFLAYAAATVFALAAAIALAIGFARPSVVALDVPQNAPAGTVRAFYAIRGRAEASYRATFADGSTLAAGNLTSSNGTIWLTVPQSATGRNVRLMLDARGTFGRDSRSATFFVSRPAYVASPAAAQIQTLTAHRETYGGSDSILASYSAMADRGVLRVTDEHGKTVGSVPFTHVGTSRVSLAGVNHSGSLRAELAVTRGNSRANAAVEIPAQAVSDPKEAALAAALRAAGVSASGAQPDGTTSDSGAIAQPTDPFYVAGRVVGGHRFTVAIRSVLPNMHVELQDDMGTTLDDAAVSSRATAVTLTAPKVSTVQTYYLAGTFVRASGEETLVRSVRIFPL